ncbi:MAG: 3-phosphoshikimate 1-carboxyvinyltransferase [Clostridiaceae bacterium]|jgi:3-phosphoshikimate 1-carboxyvinyltransferase|nr:3-phosphoshikimate 1-carboxyvinyltransferase [Clostridiaceae bacterium]
MTEVIIYPGSLEGEVLIPASKSISQRAVICAGLSEGISTINNIGTSEDIETICEAMKSLGVTIERSGSSLKIEGNTALALENQLIDCHESGSVLRFLIPIAALTGKSVVFSGKGRLIERPLTPYFDIFDKQGIKYEASGGKLPLHINGRLSPGEFMLKGNISSQFISGLMFALPLMESDSQITVTTELESKPYVDLTMKVLEDFSIDIDNHGYRDFHIKGKQKYRARDYNIEGDFSQAAFWLAAGALGSRVRCKGLDMDSLQGDKQVVEIIRSMGGRITAENDSVTALPAGTKGMLIDVSQCPDLVPIIAVLGALSEGRTEIVKAKRLRLKESDRLKAISSELGKLGAFIEEGQEGLVIYGRKSLKGGRVDSWNDHRIAMALAIAATRCKEPVIIDGASSVKKSYPDFWGHYKALGGNINERDMG